MVTPEQVRMARAAQGWSVRELAVRVGVSGNTISRYENGHDCYGNTLLRIRRTLEHAGIIFIEEDEQGGPGVRLRRTARW